MKRFAGLVLVLATLAGCGSTVPEVQDAPIAYTVEVPAAWDSVGACLAQYYTNGFEATYLPVASERRARLIVKFIGPGIIPFITIVAIFDIRGGPPATVAVREGWWGKDDKTTRAVIERCARG